MPIHYLPERRPGEGTDNPAAAKSSAGRQRTCPARACGTRLAKAFTATASALVPIA